ncbi:hypothetical protein GO001_04785 [Streptomyces sp. NRRL B-1677]|uniref:hypothetical protein n=1 Tax=Streptomyces TaxID=1883 RepID=UPI001892A29D|nr:hypothetical protein [Streptomyces sp. NRRL B-1677]MBF6044540.1 hypothetical protein [Streptomyces sp. NRRL B-1677]
MRRHTFGRLGLSATLASVVALMGMAPSASAADTPPMTVTSDKASASPGDTVTITLKFTNDQTTNTQFVYQSIQPTWNTSQDPALKYAFASCTGDVTRCDVTGKQSGSMNYNVPVLPGASRTVTLKYTVAADSACGPSRRIEFYTYLYYEYQGGQAKKDGVNSIGTDIACKTPPAPERAARAGH